MALYVESDIASNFSGDIRLDQKGDLALATSLETYKSVANFILRTDLGDYAPDAYVGSNLGIYIGARNNRDTHRSMELSIKQSLEKNVFNTVDVNADVLPLDTDEAVAFVSLAGSFLISGRLVTVEQDIMSYSFPFIDGEPTPLTI